MEMENADGTKTVCVTGASGYIASWLINLLLQRGYTIKASVRNPSDSTKIKHLYDLVGAKERLHLFKADLLEEGCFDSIVDGCQGVFHTASPCFFDAKDPQKELIEPAVKGTLNVLRSCAKTPSVKRVIVTSSTAAVIFAGKPLSPEVLVDETWFSDPKICEELKRWYALSKTLAEECAWKFAKDHKIDMITINPGMATGPLLQPTLNLSSEEILKLINGADTYNNYTYGWVDVRDVANAHILAFEVPSASGRYLLVEKVAHISEILKTLRELYPEIQLPNKCADDKPFVPTYKSSKEKCKSLGIDLLPLEVSLKETVESLREKKYFTIP
ncbi:hypothetical protein ACHQM5_018912 [Ranunculus cassubicifolius]